MAPKKMMKKPDMTGEISNPNADILSDTMPRATNTVKTWTRVFLNFGTGNHKLSKGFW